MKTLKTIQRFVSTVLVVSFSFTNTIAYSDVPSITSAFKHPALTAEVKAANSFPVRRELRELLGLPAETIAPDKYDVPASRAELRSVEFRVYETIENLHSRLPEISFKDADQALLEVALTANGELGDVKRIINRNPNLQRRFAALHSRAELRARGETKNEAPTHINQSGSRSHPPKSIRTTRSELREMEETLLIIGAFATVAFGVLLVIFLGKNSRREKNEVVSKSQQIKIEPTPIHEDDVILDSDEELYKPEGPDSNRRSELRTDTFSVSDFKLQDKGAISDALLSLYDGELSIWDLRLLIVVDRIEGLTISDLAWWTYDAFLTDELEAAAPPAASWTAEAFDRYLDDYLFQKHGIRKDIHIASLIRKALASAKLIPEGLYEESVFNMDAEETEEDRLRKLFEESDGSSVTGANGDFFTDRNLTNFFSPQEKRAGHQEIMDAARFADLSPDPIVFTFVIGKVVRSAGGRSPIGLEVYYKGNRYFIHRSHLAHPIQKYEKKSGQTIEVQIVGVRKRENRATGGVGEEPELEEASIRRDAQRRIEITKELEKDWRENRFGPKKIYEIKITDVLTRYGSMIIGYRVLYNGINGFVHAHNGPVIVNTLKTYMGRPDLDEVKRTVIGKTFSAHLDIPGTGSYGSNEPHFNIRSAEASNILPQLRDAQTAKTVLDVRVIKVAYPQYGYDPVGVTVEWNGVVGFVPLSLIPGEVATRDGLKTLVGKTVRARIERVDPEGRHGGLDVIFTLRIGEYENQRGGFGTRSELTRKNRPRPLKGGLDGPSRSELRAFFRPKYFIQAGIVALGGSIFFRIAFRDSWQAIAFGFVPLYVFSYLMVWYGAQIDKTGAPLRIQDNPDELDRSELREVHDAVAKVIKLDSAARMDNLSFTRDNMRDGVIIAQLNGDGQIDGNGTHYLMRLISGGSRPANILDLYILRFLPQEKQWVIISPTYTWEDNGTEFLLANPEPGEAMGGMGGSRVFNQEKVHHVVETKGNDLKKITWEIQQSRFETALYQVRQIEESTPESRRIATPTVHMLSKRSELRSTKINYVDKIITIESPKSWAVINQFLSDASFVDYQIVILTRSKKRTETINDQISRLSKNQKKRIKVLSPERVTQKKEGTRDAQDSLFVNRRPYEPTKGYRYSGPGSDTTGLWDFSVGGFSELRAEKQDVAAIRRSELRKAGSSSKSQAARNAVHDPKPLHLVPDFSRSELRAIGGKKTGPGADQYNHQSIRNTVTQMAANGETPTTLRIIAQEIGINKDTVALHLQEDPELLAFVIRYLKPRSKRTIGLPRKSETVERIRAEMEELIRAGKRFESAEALASELQIKPSNLSRAKRNPATGIAPLLLQLIDKSSANEPRSELRSGEFVLPTVNWTWFWDTFGCCGVPIIGAAAIISLFAVMGSFGLLAGIIDWPISAWEKRRVKKMIQQYPEIYARLQEEVPSDRDYNKDERIAEFFARAVRWTRQGDDFRIVFHPGVTKQEVVYYYSEPGPDGYGEPIDSSTSSRKVGSNSVTIERIPKSGRQLIGSYTILETIIVGILSLAVGYFTARYSQQWLQLHDKRAIAFFAFAGFIGGMLVIRSIADRRSELRNSSLRGEAEAISESQIASTLPGNLSRNDSKTRAELRSNAYLVRYFDPWSNKAKPFSVPDANKETLADRIADIINQAKTQNPYPFDIPVEIHLFNLPLMEFESDNFRDPNHIPLGITNRDKSIFSSGEFEQNTLPHLSEITDSDISKLIAKHESQIPLEMRIFRVRAFFADHPHMAGIQPYFAVVIGKPDDKVARAELRANDPDPHWELNNITAYFRREREIQKWVEAGKASVEEGANILEQEGHSRREAIRQLTHAKRMGEDRRRAELRMFTNVVIKNQDREYVDFHPDRELLTLRLLQFPAIGNALPFELKFANASQTLTMDNANWDTEHGTLRFEYNTGRGEVWNVVVSNIDSGTGGLSRAAVNIVKSRSELTVDELQKRFELTREEAESFLRALNKDNPRSELRNADNGPVRPRSVWVSDDNGSDYDLVWGGAFKQQQFAVTSPAEMVQLLKQHGLKDVKRLRPSFYADYVVTQPWEIDRSPATVRYYDSLRQRLIGLRIPRRHKSQTKNFRAQQEKNRLAAISHINQSLQLVNQSIKRNRSKKRQGKLNYARRILWSTRRLLQDPPAFLYIPKVNHWANSEWYKFLRFNELARIFWGEAFQQEKAQMAGAARSELRDHVEFDQIKATVNELLNEIFIEFKDEARPEVDQQVQVFFNGESITSTLMATDLELDDLGGLVEQVLKRRELAFQGIIFNVERQGQFDIAIRTDDGEESPIPARLLPPDDELETHTTPKRRTVAERPSTRSELRQSDRTGTSQQPLKSIKDLLTRNKDERFVAHGKLGIGQVIKVSQVGTHHFRVSFPLQTFMQKEKQFTNASIQIGDIRWATPEEIAQFKNLVTEQAQARTRPTLDQNEIITLVHEALKRNEQGGVLHGFPLGLFLADQMKSARQVRRGRQISFGVIEQGYLATLKRLATKLLSQIDERENGKVNLYTMTIIEKTILLTLMRSSASVEYSAEHFIKLLREKSELIDSALDANGRLTDDAKLRIREGMLKKKIASSLDPESLAAALTESFPYVEAIIRDFKENRESYEQALREQNSEIRSELTVDELQKRFELTREKAESIIRSANKDNPRSELTVDELQKRFELTREEAESFLRALNKDNPRSELRNALLIGTSIALGVSFLTLGMWINHRMRSPSSEFQRKRYVTKSQLETAEEESVVLEKLNQLARESAVKEMDVDDVLSALMLAFPEAKPYERFIQVVDLGIRLIQNDVNPKPTFLYVIPELKRLSHQNPSDFTSLLTEYENLMNELVRLSHRLRREIDADEYDISESLNASTIAASEAMLFLSIATRVAKAGIDPVNLLGHAFPVFVKAGKREADLTEFAQATADFAIYFHRLVPSSQRGVENIYESGIRRWTQRGVNIGQYKLILDLGIGLAKRKADIEAINYALDFAVNKLLQAASSLPEFAGLLEEFEKFTAQGFYPPREAWDLGFDHFTKTAADYFKLFQLTNEYAIALEEHRIKVARATHALFKAVEEQEQPFERLKLFFDYLPEILANLSDRDFNSQWFFVDNISVLSRNASDPAALESFLMVVERFVRENHNDKRFKWIFSGMNGQFRMAKSPQDLESRLNALKTFVIHPTFPEHAGYGAFHLEWQRLVNEVLAMQGQPFVIHYTEKVSHTEDGYGNDGEPDTYEVIDTPESIEVKPAHRRSELRDENQSIFEFNQVTDALTKIITELAQAKTDDAREIIQVTFNGRAFVPFDLAQVKANLDLARNAAAGIKRKLKDRSDLASDPMLRIVLAGNIIQISLADPHYVENIKKPADSRKPETAAGKTVYGQLAVDPSAAVSVTQALLKATDDKLTKLMQLSDEAYDQLIEFLGKIIPAGKIKAKTLKALVAAGLAVEKTGESPTIPADILAALKKLLLDDINLARRGKRMDPLQEELQNAPAAVQMPKVDFSPVRDLLADGPKSLAFSKERVFSLLESKELSRNFALQLLREIFGDKFTAEMVASDEMPFRLILAFSRPGGNIAPTTIALSPGELLINRPIAEMVKAAMRPLLRLKKAEPGTEEPNLARLISEGFNVEFYVEFRNIKQTLAPTDSGSLQGIRLNKVKLHPGLPEKISGARTIRGILIAIVNHLQRTKVGDLSLLDGDWSYVNTTVTVEGIKADGQKASVPIQIKGVRPGQIEFKIAEGKNLLASGFAERSELRQRNFTPFEFMGFLIGFFVGGVSALTSFRLVRSPVNRKIISSSTSESLWHNLVRLYYDVEGKTGEYAGINSRLMDYLKNHPNDRNAKKLLNQLNELWWKRQLWKVFSKFLREQASIENKKHKTLLRFAKEVNFEALAPLVKEIKTFLEINQNAPKEDAKPQTDTALVLAVRPTESKITLTPKASEAYAANQQLWNDLWALYYEIEGNQSDKKGIANLLPDARKHYNEDQMIQRFQEELHQLWGKSSRWKEFHALARLAKVKKPTTKTLKQFQKDIQFDELRDLVRRVKEYLPTLPAAGSSVKIVKLIPSTTALARVQKKFEMNGPVRVTNTKTPGEDDRSSIFLIRSGQSTIKINLRGSLTGLDAFGSGAMTDIAYILNRSGVYQAETSALRGNAVLGIEIGPQNAGYTKRRYLIDFRSLESGEAILKQLEFVFNLKRFEHLIDWKRLDQMSNENYRFEFSSDYKTLTLKIHGEKPKTWSLDDEANQSQLSSKGALVAVRSELRHFTDAVVSEGSQVRTFVDMTHVINVIKSLPVERFSAEAISNKLGLDLEVVKRVLEMLIEAKLLQMVNQGYFSLIPRFLLQRINRKLESMTETELTDLFPVVQDLHQYAGEFLVDRVEWSGGAHITGRDKQGELSTQQISELHAFYWGTLASAFIELRDRTTAVKSELRKSINVPSQSRLTPRQEKLLDRMLENTVEREALSGIQQIVEAQIAQSRELEPQIQAQLAELFTSDVSNDAEAAQSTGFIFTTQFVSDYLPFMSHIARNLKQPLAVVAPRGLKYLQEVEKIKASLPSSVPFFIAETPKQARNMIRDYYGGKEVRLFAVGSSVDQNSRGAFFENQIISDLKDLVIIQSTGQLSQFFNFVTDEVLLQYYANRQVAIAA